MEQKEATEEKEVVEEVTETEQTLVDEEETQEETNESVSEQLTELQNEKDELYQKLLRIQAEYDNYRKRTQREKAADLKYKSQALVTELLPVVDNFERALQAQPKDESSKQFIEGIEMVYRQLEMALINEGVEVIPTVGEEFDPNIHQAVMQVEDEQFDSNVVTEELQKGYKLKDRVIRPAMVKVNQ